LYQEDNPDVIKDLIVPKANKFTKKFSDMLTEEEIQKLIDTCDTVHHKALVSVLYDSACRCGELTKLKISDVTCNNGQWIISIDNETKTGIRNIPLTISVKYLSPWFNEYHPYRNNDNAPLFYTLSTRYNYRNPEDRVLNNTGVWFILAQLKEKAGIKKKVTPHIFRHSRLTWLGNHGMTEMDMRYFAGWKKDSNMPAFYIHTNPKNVTNAVKKAQGQKIPEESEGSKLFGVSCPRCNTENDVSSQYCKNCFIPLKQKVALKEMMVVELLRSAMYQSDPSILEDYSIETLAEKFNELLKEQAEQKKLGRKQVTA
jgi:hypothetical protein